MRDVQQGYDNIKKKYDMVSKEVGDFAQVLIFSLKLKNLINFLKKNAKTFIKKFFK